MLAVLASVSLKLEMCQCFRYKCILGSKKNIYLIFVVFFFLKKSNFNSELLKELALAAEQTEANLHGIISHWVGLEAANPALSSAFSAHELRGFLDGC